MQTNSRTFRVSAIAVAMAGVFSSGARAEEVSEVTMLSEPESRVSLGVGIVNKDNQLFGRYSGLNENRGYALADVDLNRVDRRNGTALRISGKNLGLDSREMGAEYVVQGDWGLSVDYSQIPSISKYIVTTGLQGIGTNKLTVQSTGKRDVVLDTERKRIVLGGQKTLANGWGLQLNFTNEEKDGARIFGRGTTGAGNFNFLAEPINTSTRQFEALVSYENDRFQMQGGYFGTFFRNHYNALYVAGGGTTLNAAGAGTFSPMALPPANQAHQLNLSGGYSFSPTTRATFKLAYTRATQTEGFIENPAGVVNSATSGNITGRSDLGGRVDTKLAYFGFSARPTSKSTFNANFRWEDRHDKTPVAQYVDTSTTGNHDGTNEVRSFRAISGKVEGGYQFADGYRGLAALEHESKRRSTAEQRVVSHREYTHESSLRLEVRRSLSETLNGSLAYVRSNRAGSDFLFNRTLNGTNSSNLIAPIHLADRDRDRLKLGVDWSPAEVFSLQLSLSGTKDHYDSRFGLGLGVREGHSQLASVDATFAITDNWKLTSWASRSDTVMNQRTGPNATSNPATPAAGAAAITNLFDAILRDKSDGFGVGLRGTAFGRMELGGDLQISKDLSQYNQNVLTGATIPNLDKVIYKTVSVKLFGLYPVQKNAGVKVELTHDRRRANDWTWLNWQNLTNAGDGTFVTQNPVQKTTFIGVSGYYKWW